MTEAFRGSQKNCFTVIQKFMNTKALHFPFLIMNYVELVHENFDHSIFSEMSLPVTKL